MSLWRPALERRFGLSVGQEHLIGAMRDPAAVRRFLGFAYLAAATLALLSMVVPQPPGTNVAGVLAVIAACYVMAVVLLVHRERASWLSVGVALAVGTGLISLATVFTEDRAGVDSMFYVWIALTSFFFLPWAWAFLQVALVGAAFVLVLVAEQPAAAEEHWVITVGTVLGAGVIVGVLKSRVERLLERLADAARTDALTGLRNRRGFEEALEVELERGRRTDQPVSLLVADLDHFKTVNDRLGHPAGDRALRRFGALMLTLIRRIDVAARVGGEEFALILPETAKHEAYLVAERLRRDIRASFRGDEVPLTVSVGVASHPEDGATVDALLRSGDQALYAAKQLGRDRSVLFNAEVVSGLLGAEAEREFRADEQLSAVLVLAEAIDMRDAGTATHSQTVGRYAAMIARRLGMPSAAVERIGLAGVLHDVGKIGVADAVLQKAGALTEEEWVALRKHPELGARILAGARLEDLAEWVLAHHERLDGRGYPLGLTADEIPLEARILAVADAYEAMTAMRVYSAGMSHEEAAEELRRCSGTQFDGGVVEALLVGGAQASRGATVAPRAAPALAATTSPIAISSRADSPSSSTR